MSFVFKKDNKKKDIICINCGKIGHIYKRCHLPITSYGIICIQLNGIDIGTLLSFSNKIENGSFDINDITFLKDILKNVNKKYLRKNMKYLMIKRRISFSVIEFIRGKYKLCDIDYILNTMRLMTNSEKDNLINHDFDYNWSKLWNINYKNKAKNYSGEYDESKARFNKIKSGYEVNIYNDKSIMKLEELINVSGRRYKNTEWGFPKGKKELTEIDIDCAKREFEEETDFKNEDYIVLKMNPINELFMGSNKVKYKNKYYIAQSLTNKIPEVNKNNDKQIMEIGDIGWFTLNECLNNIRDYSIEKMDVISNLSFIITYFIINLKKKIDNYSFEEK